MRLALLSAQFPPQRCGVGDYTYFLARALAQIGHDVHVLTGAGELDEVLYPLLPNVRVHRVISSWGATGLRDMIKHLRELDPQTLLIQYTPHSFDRRGITFAVNLLPVLLRIRGNIRVVTNFHEMYIPFGRSLKRNLGALWQRAAAVSLASGSHALSVTASEWERCLKRMGIRKRIKVIPVGSNIPQTTISEPDRARLRRELLGRSNGLLMAGFGAQHDRDIPAVLYGLQQILTERSAKLLWIGGRSANQRYGVSIEQAVRANGLEDKDVKWTGVLPHPEVSKLFSACDLVILPFVDGVSTRRGSAVTALQHGLPLLTTHGTSPEPWFVHGQNSYLIPAGDRQALANALVELGKNPELRARLGRAGRALYEAHFAWDVIAQQVASVAQNQQDR